MLQDQRVRKKLSVRIRKRGNLEEQINEPPDLPPNRPWTGFSKVGEDRKREVLTPYQGLPRFPSGPQKTDEWLGPFKSMFGEGLE